MAKYLLIILVLFAQVTVTAAQASSTDTCESIRFQAGLSEGSLSSGGLERAYLLYIPQGYDPTQRTPLVMSLHGFASNPAQQMEFSQWNALADRENILVVYPQGTGTPLGWNAGEVSEQMSAMVRQRPDDVAFISDLIDHLSEQYCIDTARVYATGLSNGGGMSNRLACELADRITAIGTMAGAYSPVPDGCSPDRPVPVIAFHGTADRIVPYEGGLVAGLDLPSINEWAAAWGERNGCDPTPDEMDSVGVVSIVRYTNCEGNADVILHTIEGGGHTWTGGGEHPAPFLIGVVNRDIDATARMWAFFERYALE